MQNWPSWLLLGTFLAVVIGAGSLIGVLTAPGDWYAGLAKPPFNPPNWIFAPVWLALYIAIAIAGWRTFEANPTGPIMRIWVAQMVLNWVWSPTFFSLHFLWPAAAIITAIWVLIVAFIIGNWRKDKLSSLLFIPYLAWVSFAGVLNYSIAILN